MDELESLRQQLEELKSLRERISVEQEEKVNTDIRKNIEDELSEIEKDIKDLEDDLKKVANDYEKSYKRLQTIIDEYEKKTEDTKLLSEEEINDLRKITERLKLEENERSIEIKRRLDIQKKTIIDLKRKKTIIEKNIKNAEALELSYEEYKKITSTIRKTSIMNSIIVEKGLSSIIEKPARERTKEEKDLLKQTKEEILKEITEFKKEYDDYSVLDIINALYSLDTVYRKIETPRETKVTFKELMNINQDVNRLSYMVVNSNVKTILPIEEAPKDMENATANEKVDISEFKPAEEKVSIFKDNDEYYVRKYAVDRFKLKSAELDNEVRINGSVCYKISKQDVEKIKEHANNSFSPYIADIKEITLEKKNEMSYNDSQEEKLTEKDVDDIINQEETKSKEQPREEMREKVVVYKCGDEYYVNANIVDRFKLKSVDKTKEAKANGILCYQINKDDLEKLENKQDNSISPYRIEYEDVFEVRNFTDEEIMDMLEVDPSQAFKPLKDNIIENTISEEISVEEVKDKYEAKNIKASKKFKEELMKNKVVYNVVHIISKIGKTIVRGFNRSIDAIDNVFSTVPEDDIVTQRVR